MQTSTTKGATMVDTTANDLFPRELAYRATDGVQVALYWHPRTNRLTVSVADERCGDSFELAVDSASALDAFEHPYAYAAFRGIDYRAAVREPGVAVYA
jgi:hypothetical protein